MNRIGISCNRYIQSNGIEKRGINGRVTHGYDRRFKNLGKVMDSRGNALKTGGTVVDCIHSSHVGEQCLTRADVVSGLLPTNMLLPGCVDVQNTNDYFERDDTYFAETIYKLGFPVYHGYDQ